MTKRWKPTEVLPSTAALPFSGYESKDARTHSAAPKRRSAAKPPAPAPTDAPIPRSTPAAVVAPVVRPEPQRGARPAAPGTPQAALRVWELGQVMGTLFGALPYPVTALCEACVAGDESVTFVLTTSAKDYAHARSLGLIALHGAEVSALTLAAELERATPIEFQHWMELKQRPREAWELTPRVTLGVYVSRHNQMKLSLERVLRACGASILSVADASPAPPNFWEAYRG